MDHGNGKGNLLILVWSPGKGSLVHDHAGAHCVMKVLKGKLRETLYEMPEEGGKGGEGLRVRKETEFGQDEVAYISDDVRSPVAGQIQVLMLDEQIGLHKIENADPNEVAVSLHLYTPPWAEKRTYTAMSIELVGS